MFASSDGVLYVDERHESNKNVDKFAKKYKIKYKKEKFMLVKIIDNKSNDKRVQTIRTCKCNEYRLACRWLQSCLPFPKKYLNASSVYDPDLML